MTNREGEFCEHAMGHAQADSNGIDCGTTCTKDGRECMMQCRDAARGNMEASARLSDDEIEALAKKHDASFQFAANGGGIFEQGTLLESADDFASSANVLRAYVGLRKIVDAVRDVIGNVNTDSSGMVAKIDRIVRNGGAK